jgi:hypothetical protein
MSCQIDHAKDSIVCATDQVRLPDLSAGRTPRQGRMVRFDSDSESRFRERLTAEYKRPARQSLSWTVLALTDYPRG